MTLDKMPQCGHSADCWDCRYENIMLIYRDKRQDCPMHVPPKIVNETAIKEVKRKMEKSWIDMIQG